MNIKRRIIVTLILLNLSTLKGIPQGKSETYKQKLAHKAHTCVQQIMHERKPLIVIGAGIGILLFLIVYEHSKRYLSQQERAKPPLPTSPDDENDHCTKIIPWNGIHDDPMA